MELIVSLSGMVRSLMKSDSPSLLYIFEIRYFKVSHEDMMANIDPILKILDEKTNERFKFCFCLGYLILSINAEDVGNKPIEEEIKLLANYFVTKGIIVGGIYSYPSVKYLIAKVDSGILKKESFEDLVSRLTICFRE